MNTRTTPPAIAALFTLVLLCGPAALAGEDAHYPVWWSPELGLESLDLIDYELADEFPRGEQFHLVTYGLKRVYTDALIDEAHPEQGYNWNVERINVKEQWIDNCASLFEWTGKGFRFDHDSPYWVHAFNMYALHSGECYALQALKQAKPATTSYVRNFAFDENAIDYIPAMIGMGWDCMGLNEFLQANRDGVTWREIIPQSFNGHELPVYVISVIDQKTIVVDRITEASDWAPEIIDSSVRITIYGRGDFDGDDLDDLLIRREFSIIVDIGKLYTRFSTVYVVTRREPNDALRVVDFFGSSPYLQGRCDARELIRESGRFE